VFFLDTSFKLVFWLDTTLKLVNSQMLLNAAVVHDRAILRAHLEAALQPTLIKSYNKPKCLFKDYLGSTRFRQTGWLAGCSAAHAVHIF
jgi:hypothetical protein